MLKKLTNGDILADKKICCMGSTGYIIELVDKYHISEQIIQILDRNPAKCGNRKVNGRDIPVVLTEQITDEADLIIITDDYFKEAYDVIYGIVGDAYGDIFYFANRETEYEEVYREKYKGDPLEDIIIFRSGPHVTEYVPGMDFYDNSRALFEYMLECNLNRRYRLIWIVKNPEEFSSYTKIHNVEFLAMEWSVATKEEERDRYYHALCLAKFIFFTDAYGFARNCRKDQIRVQLWHGCGFKTRLTFVPCEKRYEYMTVTSPLYADIHAKLFGLEESQMLVTGCAKGDWLFEGTDKNYKSLLGIPEAGKYVYWLPTYRQAKEVLAQDNGYEIDGDTGLPIIDTLAKMNSLNAKLQDVNTVLVIKLHPYQDKNLVKDFNYSNIVLLDNEQLFANDIQINQLLHDADAMISDYSSAAVDYLMLERPIGFVMEDADAYENARGFIFEHIRDWIPGVEITSLEDFERFVTAWEMLAESDSERIKYIADKLQIYHDGNSCKRIVDELGIE